MLGEREQAGQYFHKGYLRPLLFGCSSTVPPGRQSAGSGAMMKRQSRPHEKWATYSSSDSEAAGWGGRGGDGGISWLRRGGIWRMCCKLSSEIDTAF